MKAASRVLLALLVIVPLACATTGDGGYGKPTVAVNEPMTALPPPGVDVVQHNLTIELHRITAGADGKLPGPCESAESVGAKAELLEDIVFGGRMVLQRGKAFVNRGGYQQQPFMVTAWSANGYSKALGTTIQYVLSSEKQQIESSITSERKDSAFPVTFDFNVIFDAYANGRLVRPGHHGRPKGYGFLTVPPSGDRRLSPTIREFEDCFVDVPDPRGERALFRFRPKECNDEKGETVATLAQASP